MEPQAPTLEQQPAPALEHAPDQGVEAQVVQVAESAPESAPAETPAPVEAVEAAVATAQQETEVVQAELPPHHQSVVVKLEEALSMQATTPAKAALLSTTLRDARAA